MRASNFEHQTATRKAEYSIIERAVSSNNTQSMHLDDWTDSGSESCFLGHKMTYHFGMGVFLNSKKKIQVPVPQFAEHPYMLTHIINFLDSIFQDCDFPDTGLPMYTRASLFIESNTKGKGRYTLFRADPLWKAKKKNGSPLTEHVISEYGWQDFAQVRWITDNKHGRTEFTSIPARLILFLTIPEGCHANDLADKVDYPPGKYALINSCVESLDSQPPSSETAREYYKNNYADISEFTDYLAHASCSILYWSMLEQTEVSEDPHVCGRRFPKLYLVRIEDITDTCIGVPYDLEENPSIQWLFIKNRRKWKETFVDDMKVRLEASKL